MSCKTCQEASQTIQALAADAKGEPLTEAQIDFIGCLIPSLLAALPVFLENFMKCLAGTGTGGYKPGDRDRC